MSDILAKFVICSKIKQLKNEIVLVYVFNDSTIQKNILFVTSDDKVYSMGNNAFGVCGVGHNDKVENAKEVPELSGKGCKQFCHGSSFVLALTDGHKIYSWGSNDRGQLARCQVTDIYQTPDQIELDYDFVDISCGEHHAMALTTEGRVYVWGDKSFGQYSEDSDSMKFEVNYMSTLPKIRSIYCSYKESYVITTEGMVYLWQQIVNHKYNNSELELDLINYTVFNDLNCLTISSCKHNTYFLAKNGQLFFKGKLFPSPVPIDFKGTIFSMLLNLDLNNPYSECCVLVETTDGTEVHYLKGNQIFRTDYNNFIEYCAEES